MSLSPIVFFAFNRPNHTRESLTALSKNELAKKSDLFVYLDGPRNPEQLPLITQTKEVILSFKDTFNNLILTERKSNIGLAANIIAGITEVINAKEKAIILEDDIVVSPTFLNYMNDALNYYEQEKRVWNICAFAEKNDEIKDFFFSHLFHCWGWATWKDRWLHFEKNPQDLINKYKDNKYKFDFDNSIDFWSQLNGNNNGIINTWAVFWYATVLNHDGLNLTPTYTYIKNIGCDGSGINCSDVEYIKQTDVLNTEPFKPLFEIEINQLKEKEKKDFFRAITSQFIKWD